MYQIKRSLIFTFLFIRTLTAFSQIAIGEWRTHFSYNSAKQVVCADDKIYVVSNGELYSYSTDNGDLETYSILTGLSDHDISYISWCKAEKTLIIVYSNGNIDFLKGTDLINLSDFKNKSLSVDKTIYAIRTEKSKAYLSTGVGLLVINVSKHEIEETYYLNFSSGHTKVYDVVVWGDSIETATASGLYLGNIKSNLLDASNWYPVSFDIGTKATQIVRFNNQAYVLAENGMVYRNDYSGWSVFLNDPNASSLSVQNGYLFICAGKKTYMYNSAMEPQDVDSVQNYSVALDSITNMLYIASGKKGLSILSRINSKYSILKDSLLPNGPSQITTWNAFFNDGAYFSTPGGRWGDRYFYDGDVMTFKNECWSNLKDKQAIEVKTGLPLQDFMNLAIDPFDNRHYFISSWGEGLYEFRDSVFYKLHTYTNSPLRSSVSGNPRYIRIDGATFDKDGNLWVLNSNTDSVIQILKPDGSWYIPHYPNLPQAPSWNSILFTKTNQVWMNSPRVTQGLFVMDFNQTLEQTADDKFRWFSSFTDQDGITLSPFYIQCLTEDLNGKIWIGTYNGPFIVSNPSNVFDSDFRFTRIKIPRNNGTDNVDYLLNNIWINCITVDGGNRKWIGTNGYGVYLISADGLSTIQHFNTENSPLPSNYVWSVATNPKTGEVFFGTDQGMVSYRNDATQGEEDYHHVHVFPNPVKPDYTGLITVTGLMENTQIKITDMSGNVLISGISVGGQFSWNGYTKHGKHAGSGVYLVFCVSEDGKENQACKFIIIK